MNTEKISSRTFNPSQASQRDLVRELARRVAEIAASSENQAIRKRWCDVNALRKPDRAPVWCRPCGCWTELVLEDTLICQDPWLRDLELGFRRILKKHEINDDSPLEPYFAVNAVFDIDPSNRWGVQIGRHLSDEAGGAWGYDPPLKTKEDFENLKMPSFSYNPMKTHQQLERMEELLDDVIPVKLVCNPGYDNLSATLGTAASELRGLEQLMMDTIIEPQLLHQLMAHVRDAKMRELDAWEASGLLVPNSGPMLCSDPVGQQSVEGKLNLKNCWCTGNSQEFDQVSPEMWKEFLLEYQKPIFERFAHVCYGCCEDLTHKIDSVLSIPNLRIFVCSAWTSLDIVLDRIGTDYCIMWRQKASEVVFPDDTATIRRELEEGIKRLRGRRYQVVLRELQTLAGHPDRLHVWTDIAKEMTTKYS